MAERSDPVGLIAGQGALPLLVARGIRAAGRPVYAIGLAGQYDHALIEVCDQFRQVGLARLGQWIRTMRRWQVSEAIMVGRVAHERKYARFQFLRYTPDWRALKLWYRHLRGDRRTAALLTALADELALAGVTLIDSRTYIQDHLAQPGLMTPEVQPSTQLQRDIDFGWPLLDQILRTGIGQTLAVRSCDVVAVEAAEGTDAMIDRAGRLCGGRPWVLFKSCAARHDMRADVPTVGQDTLERLHAAGGRAVVLGAGRVILLDKPLTLARGRELGIAIIGR